MKQQQQLLEDYLKQIQTELRQHVIPFWLKYSLDKKHGGYYNCLDIDGTVYDKKKHIWLQGRQVWMLSKLYNHVNDFHTEEIVEAAKLGANFLKEHVKRQEDNRVFFCVTEDGQPVYLQRKLFSECFYIMAMVEFSRTFSTESPHKTEYFQEGLQVFTSVLEWIHKGEIPMGRPTWKGQTAEAGLAIPMILLNLITEIRSGTETIEKDFETQLQKEEIWCVQQIKKHVCEEKKLVLETIHGETGEFMWESPEGRLINPGHNIECAWFLLDYATKRLPNQSKEQTELIELSLKMLDWSYEIGYDKQFGGILYFVDALGFPPTPLEWDRKLWWVHNETMVAFIKAYQVTKNEKYLQLFKEITDYSFKHFSDPKNGEWFGYLNRQGEVSQRMKGGAYKGCFHVPRALFLCEQVLLELLNEK